MTLMTISELEKASGARRSAIHFYLREGLLPPATRTTTNRALYTEAHLHLISEIRRLQEEGLRLSGIKKVLEPVINGVEVEEVDLSDRSEAVRRSLMQIAARAFAAKGYTRTRVADIIREAETTPQVFYSHFQTKRDLFLECLEVFSDLAMELIEPKIANEPDTVKHAALRAFGNLWLREISPAPMSLAAAEAVHEDSQTAEAYYKGYDKLVSTVIPDLVQIGREKPGASPFPSDWLVATALMGVIEATVGRQSWDERLTKRDVLLTVLFVWLGIEAVYGGEVDVRSKRAEYERWVDELLETPLPVPGSVNGGAARS
ncbi:MAG: MerR family transcriptional regulator [Actinobacteria bacterium]|nr:MerR family transcriptional regulator [Actinomycetota bacterium]